MTTFPSKLCYLLLYYCDQNTPRKQSKESRFPLPRFRRFRPCLLGPVTCVAEESCSHHGRQETESEPDRKGPEARDPLPPPPGHTPVTYFVQLGTPSTEVSRTSQNGTMNHEIPTYEPLGETLSHPVLMSTDSRLSQVLKMRTWPSPDTCMMRWREPMARLGSGDPSMMK